MAITTFEQNNHPGCCQHWLSHTGLTLCTCKVDLTTKGYMSDAGRHSLCHCPEQRFSTWAFINPQGFPGGTWMGRQIVFPLHTVTIHSLLSCVVSLYFMVLVLNCFMKSLQFHQFVAWCTASWTTFDTPAFCIGCWITGVPVSQYKLENRLRTPDKRLSNTSWRWW